MDWANRIIAWLLRSPLHQMMSKNTLLLTYIGRKSHQTITLPVNYINDETGFSVLSWKKRMWWRNLRGRAAVTLVVAGKTIEARGEVEEGIKAVVAGLQAHLQQSPALATAFHLTCEEDGSFTPDAVAQVAADKVIVHLTPITT